MDRQRIEDCLVQVVAYQASGKKAKQWSAEQGVPLRHLVSWCAHARRWRARLDGAPAPATPRPQPRPRPEPSGFVQARVAPSAQAPKSPQLMPEASVRIDLQAGAVPMALRWPLTHTRELAAWVRDIR